MKWIVALAAVAVLSGCLPERTTEEVIDRQLVPMKVQYVSTGCDFVLVLVEVESGAVHEVRKRFCSVESRYRTPGTVLDMLVRTIEYTKPTGDSYVKRVLIHEC